MPNSELLQIMHLILDDVKEFSLIEFFFLRLYIQKYCPVCIIFSSFGSEKVCGTNTADITCFFCNYTPLLKRAKLTGKVCSQRCVKLMYAAEIKQIMYAVEESQKIQTVLNK